MEHPNPIDEARRYLLNARTLLSEKARKEDGLYQDRKYVKLAGHAAYAGILLALDAVFGKKTKGRKDVNWYKECLTKSDKRMLDAFLSAYSTLHLEMSYDGNRSSSLANFGLQSADAVVDWAAERVV